MKQAEWLACTDPRAMIQSLGNKTSGRKLRLFACACVRRVWHLLGDERSRIAVEVGEQYADRLVSWEEVIKVEGAADEVVRQNWDQSVESAAAHAAALTAVLWAPVTWVATETASWVARYGESVQSEEQRSQATILRDLFGPHPFRHQQLDSSVLAWRDGTVTKLAQAIYEERAFDRLPILADALEDAGCTNADILTHCRQPGEHVRGCWVVDLLLGKN
jgi:hypothetical protein